MPKTFPNQARHNATLCLLAAMLRCVGVVYTGGGQSSVRPHRGLPIRILSAFIKTKRRLKEKPIPVNRRLSTF
jgi:hypothetical protein